MLFLARAYAGVLGFVGRKNVCACIYIYIFVFVFRGGLGGRSPPSLELGYFNLLLGKKGLRFNLVSFLYTKMAVKKFLIAYAGGRAGRAVNN